jgi:hypothetical protein
MSTDDEIKEHLKRIAEMRDEPDFDFEEVKMEAEAMPEPELPDKDYAEFVINTARRIVKQENSLVRQILYSAMSKDTGDPSNLGIVAPTSEGKTYPVIEVLKFFPSNDVHYIGRMSTMPLVRQKGILVDSNNQPVKDKIKELKEADGPDKIQRQLVTLSGSSAQQAIYLRHLKLIEIPFLPKSTQDTIVSNISNFNRKI